MDLEYDDDEDAVALKDGVADTDGVTLMEAEALGVRVPDGDSEWDDVAVEVGDAE